MQERALPLDEQQLAAAARTLQDERFARRRRGSPTPQRRRRSPTPQSRSRSGRSGTNSEAIAAAARLAVELERDRHLPDRAVGADGEHDRAVELEVRAGRDVEARRAGGAGRAARRRGWRRARRARGRRRGTRAGRSRRRARARRSRAAARARPAGSGRPRWRRRRARWSARTRSASSTRADDRDPLVRLARPRRVEDRHDGVAAVADHAAGGLPVVRVGRVALGEDEIALRRPTPRPGSSEGSWTPSTKATPGHGSSASRRLPSRSTCSQSEASWQRGRDAEPGLDHAAEHHVQPERPRRVGHAHRLADAARLGELDVDPVRALGAGGDACRAPWQSSST